MKSSTQLGAVVGIACLAALLHWIADGRPAGDPVEMAEDLPLKDGERRLEEIPDGPGVVWIDARRGEVWNKEGLKGSLNLSLLGDEPLDAQISGHLEVLAGAAMLVIYCDDARCGLSHDLAAELKRSYGDLISAEIVVLHGGAAALKSAGRIRSSNRGS